MKKHDDIPYLFINLIAEIGAGIILLMPHDSSGGLEGLIVLPLILVFTLVNPILITRAVQRLTREFSWMDITRIVVYGIAMIPFIGFVLAVYLQNAS
jgi:hypothetical protein